LFRDTENGGARLLAQELSARSRSRAGSRSPDVANRITFLAMVVADRVSALQAQLLQGVIKGGGHDPDLGRVKRRATQQPINGQVPLPAAREGKLAKQTNVKLQTNHWDCRAHAKYGIHTPVTFPPPITRASPPHPCDKTRFRST
jgi:hypothetical protein